MMTTFNGNIHSLNINKICRICLSESRNMKSVFNKLNETEILEADIFSLSDMISKVTSIPVSFSSVI